MTDQSKTINPEIKLVIHEIGDLLAAARSNVARQVNFELLSTCWNIGRIIAEYEQRVPERADYGKQTLKELSKALTNEFGKGFSLSNSYYMLWGLSNNVFASRYVLYMPKKEQLIAQVEQFWLKKEEKESDPDRHMNERSL